MAAGSIVIDLLARTGSFDSSIDRSTKAAEKRFKELQKQAAGIGTAIAASFAAVSAGAALLVKSSIDSMDALNDMAQQTGVTTEALSALTYAAQFGAVSQEELVSSLTKLNRTMFDATDSTSEAARAFKALGVDVENADGKLRSSDQVLIDVADRFSKMTDGAQKTALAVQLFGKSGAALIPFLNQGAEGIAAFTEEAQAFGVVVGQDAADAAGVFNDNLDRLAAAGAGFGNQLTQIALPALTQLSELLVDLAKNQNAATVATETVGFAFKALLTVFQTLAVVGSDVGFVFLSVGREIAAWAAQLQAVASGDLRGFTAISDAVKEDGIRARAELDKFQQRIMAIGSPAAPLMGPPRSLAGGAPSAVVDFTAGGGGKKTKAAKDNSFERYMDGLKKQIEGTKELSEVEQVLTDIQEKRLKNLTSAQAGTLVGLAQELDASKALKDEEKSREESARRLADAQKQVADEAAAVYDSTRTPLEKYLSKLERLNELYDAGHIKDVDTYTRATKLLGDEFVKSGEKVEETVTAMSKFAERAQENIQDALGDTLEQTLSGNFDNIGDMWLKLLQKMAAQALAAQLNDALFPKKEGGGSGNILGDLFNAGMSLFSGGSGASIGGESAASMDSFPGILSAGESSIPMKAASLPSGGGYGAVNINQNISVGSNVSMPDVYKATQQMKNETLATIARSRRQSVPA